ncbi:unnamed protein product [Symbiodinium sp. CCMP2592]|nr:unnamed protein product [Symbiodinium sp. CCMP2592]
MPGLKQPLKLQDCPAAVSAQRGGRRRLSAGPPWYRRRTSCRLQAATRNAAIDCFQGSSSWR